MESSIALFALLVLIVCGLILVGFVLKGRKAFSKQEKRFFNLQWQIIKKQPDLKHAVLEADKLLNMILEKKGYRGTLGEKLKASAKLFTHLDAVWSAHKLRNKIAHELNFHVSLADGKQALNSFEKAFRDLQAL